MNGRIDGGFSGTLDDGETMPGTCGGSFPRRRPSFRKKAILFSGKTYQPRRADGCSKKKGISSTGSRLRHPLPDRAASGSMRPLGTRFPALRSARRQWHVRFSCTTAFDRRRRKAPSFYEQSSAVLMPGAEPESCPGNPIYHKSPPRQCGKPPGTALSPAQTRFFPTWSSLLYKFRSFMAGFRSI